MKEFMQIWNKVSGRRYSAVNTHGNGPRDRELRDLSNNRLRKNDLDTSAFEANFAECEGLNTKFQEENEEFGESRKDAIIDRLFEKRRKGRVRLPKGVFMLMLLGFFGIAAGCFILFVHPYDVLFNLKIVMAQGGEIFEMWRKPEVDLYIRIYLFNVTNRDEFMAGKEKLNMVQVGPYVYKEAFEHSNITFNDNGTLNSIPTHPLTWIEEMSEGHREDDKLILPNIALLSISNVMRNAYFITRYPLNKLIQEINEQPLVEMTAKEFMFDYKSRLVTLGNTWLSGWITFDKLGLIDRMYDFNGDFETVFTGETDIRSSGLIDKYKGSADLPQWNGQHCSNVQNASDGTKFLSAVQKDDQLLFYRKSMCRAAPVVYVEEGERSSLSAYKFTFENNTMDNGRRNEENKCFCRNEKCLPDGLVDITDCYYGFPIALSYPHFYKGEASLLEHVDGMKPNKSIHESYFWIQPESGLPLDVAVRFQINLALDDISNMQNTQKFGNMILPLLWFEIRMFSLPQNLADRFRLYINVLPIVEQSAMWLLFFVGAVLVSLSVHKLLFQVVFRSYGRRSSGSKKRKTNLILGSEFWVDSEFRRKRNSKDDFSNKTVYAPCEIPLNESASNEGFVSSDTHTDSEEYTQEEEEQNLRANIHKERNSSGFLKTHGDRIKELGHRLSDKVQDTVGSLKEKMTGHAHVEDIFEGIYEPRKNSSAQCNDAYKSDSCESSSEDTETEPLNFKKHGENKYQIVDTSDNECKYLEVVEDERNFDDLSVKPVMDRRKSIEIELKRQRMNSLENPKPLSHDILINLPNLDEEDI